MNLYEDDDEFSDESRDDMSIDSALSSDESEGEQEQEDEDDSFIANDSSSLEEEEAEYDDDGIDPKNILGSRLRAQVSPPARFWDEHVDQSILWADADVEDVFEPLRSDDDIRSDDDMFSDEEDDGESD